MLTPEQIRNYPDNLVKLYARVEADIIADMAEKISAAAMFIPSTEYHFKRLQVMKNTYDDILTMLSALTNQTDTSN